MFDIQKIPSSITLVRGREHSLKKQHHWLFSGAVSKIDGSPTDGDLVTIKDHKGRPLGYGFFGSQSISVRILAFDLNLPPEQKIEELLKQARKRRKKLGLLNSETTDSFRLFHSEGDCLPGLTIDKFNKIFVIQTHHQGINPYLDVIKNYILRKFPETESILLKTGKSQEGNDNFKFLFGENSKCTIKENGILFEVDIIEGQKTGFFLDQRDNRFKLGSLSKDKSILNLFCFSGGFSIYALKSGASHVVSVDSSESAINALKNNLSLNNIPESSSTLIVDNCESYLKGSADTFDIVISDPPAFVKNRNHFHKGLAHYKELQKLSLPKVKDGGLFFTFSCSQFISEKDLSKAVLSAAKELGITLDLVEVLKQAPCHTINPAHLESMYLKGFLFRKV